jgi:hypothetical protein
VKQCRFNTRQKINWGFINAVLRINGKSCYHLKKKKLMKNLEIIRPYLLDSDVCYFNPTNWMFCFSIMFGYDREERLFYLELYSEEDNDFGDAPLHKK